jgi:hypothetical protein
MHQSGWICSKHTTTLGISRSPVDIQQWERGHSLSGIGKTYTTSKYTRKACNFLTVKQREDGGRDGSYKARVLAYTLGCLSNSSHLTVLPCHIDARAIPQNKRGSVYLNSMSLHQYIESNLH